jgi:hypothetical protein
VGVFMASLITWDKFLSTHVSQISKFVSSLRRSVNDESGRQPESIPS